MFVDFPELLVNGPFLAEILGNADPGHRFLDRLVNFAHDPRALAGDAAGKAAEGEGGDGDERGHGQHGQGERYLIAEEDGDEDEGAEDLVDDVVGEQNDLAELLRVAGDAADDPAGAELVVESHVLLRGCGEGVGAHLQDHVGDDLGSQAPPDPVGGPVGDAGGEEDDDQERQQVAPPRRGDRFHPVGDDQGQRGADGGHHGRCQAHDGQFAPVGPEVAEDPLQELAVVVFAVVGLGVEASHHHSHEGQGYHRPSLTPKGRLRG